MSPTLWRGPAVVAALAAMGGAVAASGTQHLAVALACLLVLVTLGVGPVVVALVAATFVTRFRFEVAGVNFLLEHCVLVVGAVVLFVQGRGAGLVASMRDRSAVLVGMFVVWNGVVSVVQAEEPGESILIVGWLALDWLMLVVLSASASEPGMLVRPAVVCAGFVAGVAVAIGASAHFVGGDVGMSVDAVTGGKSVHGLSHEPNVLGATLALWAFVVFTSARYRHSRGRKVAVVLCVLGMLMTLTRAAMVGLAGGVLVWSLFRGRTARRAVGRAGAAFAVLLVVLWLAVPSVARPIFAKGGELLNFGSQTGQVRVEQWRQAVEDLDGTDWVIGLGTNSYGQRHLEPTMPDTPTPAYLGNFPLQVLYDSGVVGLVLLGAVLMSLLTRQRLRDGRAAGLLAVYVLCAVGTSPFWFGTTWLLVAIAVVDRRQAASRCVAATAGRHGVGAI